MTPRTDEEVIRDGVAAVHERLGLVDSGRFMRLVARRSGDYTADRASFLDVASAEEELMAFLDRLDREATAGPTHVDHDHPPLPVPLTGVETNR